MSSDPGLLRLGFVSPEPHHVDVMERSAGPPQRYSRQPDQQHQPVGKRRPECEAPKTDRDRGDREATERNPEAAKLEPRLAHGSTGIATSHSWSSVYDQIAASAPSAARTAGASDGSVG